MWTSASVILVARTPSAPIRRVATSALASMVSLGIPSPHVQTRMNARPRLIYVVLTLSARIPTRASGVSVPPDLVATPTSAAKLLRFALSANPTLIAPTTPCVRKGNVFVVLASWLRELDVSMWTSVEVLQESAVPTLSVETVSAHTPAPVHPPSWAIHQSPLVLSPVRELHAVNTPTARPRRRTPTVYVRMAGHMIPRTLLLAALM